MDKQHDHILDYCSVIQRTGILHHIPQTVYYMVSFMINWQRKTTGRKECGRVEGLIQSIRGEYLETELVPVLIVVAHIRM